MHSLGFAARGNDPYGEIGFVVVLPQDAVACLEVKGGVCAAKRVYGWQLAEPAGSLNPEEALWCKAEKACLLSGRCSAEVLDTARGQWLPLPPYDGIS
jgi:hypothetical protein